MGWNLRRPNPMERSTGDRNITALITGSTVESGSLKVARVGNTVMVSFDSLVVEEAGWAELVTLPSGFRPVSTFRVAQKANPNAQYALYKTGGISLHRSATPIRELFTYITDNPWPNVLPGVKG